MRRVVVSVMCTWLACGCAEDRPVATGETRGASLGLFASDPQYDYSQMLAEIEDRGATDVLLVYRLMQSDIEAHDLRLAPGSSPAEETIRRTIDQAARLGLRVGLMPIVGLTQRDSGEWRGELRPRAGAAVWFSAYRAHVLLAATIAAEHGLTRLFVGSELSSLEIHRGAWDALITEVRSVFSGELSYSANWDRYQLVPFWDSLDVLAVSAYFPVGRLQRPSVDAAISEWTERLGSLHRFADIQGKPLVLSEVGYPAHAEAWRFPWDETRAAPVDNQQQAELLGAFCEAYSLRSGAGYYVWNWFGPGGPRASGYSPRGKPAAAVFERCMEQRSEP